MRRTSAASTVRGRVADRGALRRVIEDTGADALLVVGATSRDPDLLPFTGETRLGDCFVLARADGVRWLGYHSVIEREEAAATGLALLDPATLRVADVIVGGRGSRLARSLGIALRRAKLPGRRVAIAGRYPNGDLAQALAQLRHQGFRFTSGHDAVLRLRRPKRGAELDEIRGVAAATNRALRGVARILSEAGRSTRRSKAEGRSSARRKGRRARGPAVGPELVWRGGALTVGVVRREVAATFAAAGLDQPEGNLIAPGRQGAVPHNTGDPSSVLRAGESLIVDLFPRRRLHADCTRTFCVGAAPPELLAAHRAVLDALVLARERARVGTRGFAIQEEVCRHFEALGYPTSLQRPVTAGYVHGLGHGVGFEVHELPHFRRDGALDQGILERDDVFTLEPGLYDPEAGYGVRLEDLCRLGPGGVEILTPLPYDLDPRAWLRDDGA